MATNNYSLPTILGTNAFDLVTDYNALANATDAALASVAGLIPTESITEMEGQISALQTLTGSQGTQITTLQSQMSTANGNIATVQSGLETANNNIGTLQTGLQSANASIAAADNNINTLSYDLRNLFKFTHYQSSKISGESQDISTTNFHLLVNPTQSLFKFYGQFNKNSAFINFARKAIPGLPNWYGIEVTFDFTFSNVTEALQYDSMGEGYTDLSGNAQNLIYWGILAYVLGTDGKIYLAPSQTKSFNMGASNAILNYPQLLVTTNNAFTTITE